MREIVLTANQSYFLILHISHVLSSQYGEIIFLKKLWSSTAKLIKLLDSS